MYVTSFYMFKYLYPAYYRKYLKWLTRVKLKHSPLEVRVCVDRIVSVHFMPHCSKMESASYNTHPGSTSNYKPFGGVCGWIFTVFSCHCICVRSLALQDLNIHGRNTKTASTSEHSPFVNVAIFVHMQILFRGPFNDNRPLQNACIFCP